MGTRLTDLRADKKPERKIIPTTLPTSQVFIDGTAGSRGTRIVAVSEQGRNGDAAPARAADPAAAARRT